MPSVDAIPENLSAGSLGWLRKRARDLARAVRAGEPAAIARVQRHRPGTDPAEARLSTAQLVVAREYGFTSWPRLRRYLELVADRSWDTTPPAAPAEDPADTFCRLACLTYLDDGPDRWASARQLLADHPDLTGNHIWAAAAAAEPATVRQLLTGDPGLARRRGGPYRWTPLCYLAYSRMDLAVPAEPVLAVARLLLAAGADPDEGYLWHGRPYPFTLLTGAFGEGELGPTRQPRHPHALALAQLLLAAGADPNDSQTLYNRQFQPDNDHLELLFRFGLGTGSTYPWRERLGELLGSPPDLLRAQLRWAVEHGLAERVRLLAGHGVDVIAPYPDQATPAQLAAGNGFTAIVEMLAGYGAVPPQLDPMDTFVGAVLAGDRATVERLRAVAAEVRRARPELLVWAAGQGRIEAVRLLVELDFDVDTLGRGDAPVAGQWETALHHAAAQGNSDLARLLLDAGADPGIRDCRFHATPLGWAQHFGQQELATLLAPITPEG